MIKKVLLLLALITAVFLMTTGCNNKVGPDDQANPQKDPYLADRAEGNKNSKDPGDSSPANTTNGKQAVSTGGKDAAAKEEDLIIQSENQVLAGSKQEMVNELDKELDTLMKSLDNLDTVNDSDLDLDLE